MESHISELGGDLIDLWRFKKRKAEIVVEKNSKNREREGFQRIICKQYCLMLHRGQVAMLEVLNLEKANKDNLRFEIWLV